MYVLMVGPHSFDGVVGDARKRQQPSYVTYAPQREYAGPDGTVEPVKVRVPRPNTLSDDALRAEYAAHSQRLLEEVVERSPLLRDYVVRAALRRIEHTLGA